MTHTSLSGTRAPARHAGLDAVFAALADPTRRAILERLADREARVTEIAAPFAMSLNAVSKHIRVLEASGLIHRRRQGREHVLAADVKALNGITDWIDQTRRFWNQRLDSMERLLRERGGKHERGGKQDRGDARKRDDKQTRDDKKGRRNAR